VFVCLLHVDYLDISDRPQPQQQMTQCDVDNNRVTEFSFEGFKVNLFFLFSFFLLSSRRFLDVLLLGFVYNFFVFLDINFNVLLCYLNFYFSFFFFDLFLLYFLFADCNSDA